jgi:hypothetical protein
LAAVNLWQILTSLSALMVKRANITKRIEPARDQGTAGSGVSPSCQWPSKPDRLLTTLRKGKKPLATLDIAQCVMAERGLLRRANIDASAGRSRRAQLELAFAATGPSSRAFFKATSAVV